MRFDLKWLMQLLTVLMVLMPIGVLAQTSETPAEETAQSTQTLISILKDPDSREALIKALEAQTKGGEVTPQTEATPERRLSLAVRIGNATQKLYRDTEKIVLQIYRSLVVLPIALTANTDAEWNFVKSGFIDIAVLLAITFTANFIFLRYGEKLVSAFIKRTGQTNVLARGGMLLGSAVVGALMTVAAWGVGYIMVIVTNAGGESSALELIEMLFLNAFLLVQLSKVVLRFVICPAFPKLRLIPLDNAQASYWTSWLSFIVSWLGYGLMFVLPVASQKLSFMLTNSLRITIVLCAVIIAIFAIFNNRKATRDRIKSYAAEFERGLMRSGLNILARSWHFLALAYVLLLFVVWVSRPVDATAFMGRATGLSILALMLGSLLTVGLKKTVKKGLTLPSGMNEALPALQSRVNVFIPTVYIVLQGLIFVVVTLTILQAWEVVDFTGWLSSAEGETLVGNVTSAGIVLLVGFIIWLGAMSWVDARVNPANRSVSSREKTLLGLFRNAFTVLLAIMIFLLSLAELGVEIGPLIAGAGVFGLAISFGAQTMVRDIITGAFIQVENAMNEGDVVTVAGVSGTVEKLTIRSVTIRDLSGTTHIIPFSSVSSVANSMRGFAYHVAVIGVGYESDITQVKAAMKEAFDRLKETSFGVSILGDLEMHGVTEFGDNAISVRARIKTLPGSQWGVGRAYNECIKTVFDEQDIEIPFPQVVYHRARESAEEAEALPPMGKALLQKQKPIKNDIPASEDVD